MMYGQRKVSRAKTERMVRMARMEKTESPVNRVYKVCKVVFSASLNGAMMVLNTVMTSL